MRVPWLFRETEPECDSRDVDLSKWGPDQHFKNTFLALQSAPTFANLFENESISVPKPLDERVLCSEGDAVMYFLQDLIDHLGFRRPTGDGDAFFYLRLANPLFCGD
jgi:hypothetical protein